MERWAAWLRKHARTAAWGIAALSALGLWLYDPFQTTAFAAATVAHGSGWSRAALGLAIGWLCAWASLPKLTARQLCSAVWTGAALALTSVVGQQLQNAGTLAMNAAETARSVLCLLGLSALNAALLSFLLQKGGALLRRKGRLTQACERLFPRGSRRLFWSAWGLIFACWTPVWLAYYPALGNYDLASHVAQCVSNQYNTMHPLLYTLLIKLCMLAAGSRHELALALLALLQMLCMSACFAYAVAELRRLGARAWLCVLGVLYFALFPVFPLMAVSTTKDVLFSALALLVGVQLYAMLREPKRFRASAWHSVALILSATGMGLLRYNGVISLAIYTVAFLLLWRSGAKRKSRAAKQSKRACVQAAALGATAAQADSASSVKGTNAPQRARSPRLRLAALMAAVLVLVAVGTRLLNAAMDASSSFVTARDIASLPSQQMIRTAKETDDYGEYLSIMRWYGGETALNRYRPCLADYTKKYIDVDHDNGWRGYYETWLKVGLRHPWTYVEAFLELNRGLWFADDLSHTHVYVNEDAAFGYLTNNQYECEAEGYPISYTSLLPSLRKALDALTAQNGFLRLPFLRLLFSVGAQCWLSVLAAVAAAYRRDRAAKWFALWPLTIALVLMVAPCVIVRYALPIFCLNVPIVLAVTREGSREEPIA